MYMNYWDEDEYDHEATGWHCNCPQCQTEKESNEQNYTYQEREVSVKNYYIIYDEIIGETEKAYELSINVKNRKDLFEVIKDIKKEDDITLKSIGKLKEEIQRYENNSNKITTWIPKSQCWKSAENKFKITEFLYYAKLNELPSQMLIRRG